MNYSQFSMKMSIHFIHKILFPILKSRHQCARKNSSVNSQIVFTPHAGPSAAYGPEAMGYMMDGQAHMMQRPPGDPGFHQGYAHYPPADYYGHHL